MGEPVNESVSVSVVWPNIEDVPVQPANAFVVQLGNPGPDGKPDPGILTLGFIAPPAVMGSPDQQMAMIAALGAVQARTLGRYQLTRPRLQELIQLLHGLADNWDRILRMTEEGTEGEGQ